MCTQTNWEDFGIDWDSPVPVDDDSTVVVDALPSVLTAEKHEELEELLDRVDSLSIDEADSVLTKYIVARLFVCKNAIL